VVEEVEAVRSDPDRSLLSLARVVPRLILVVVENAPRVPGGVWKTLVGRTR
jgi:hypothetical protein